MTIPYKDVAVGLIKDSALLGNFSLPALDVPPPIDNINMITFSTISFDDPWIVPSDSELDSFDDAMPVSPFGLSYQEV